DAGDAAVDQGAVRAQEVVAFETVVNVSESDGKAQLQKADDNAYAEKQELSAEVNEYKSKAKQVLATRTDHATRLAGSTYLSDYRENTLYDVITKIEPELFKAVTALTVEDFNLLVSLGLFNASHMNQAVFAFRRYEDASLSYTGIESHEGLRRYGLYDTVVAVEETGGARSSVRCSGEG